LLKRGTNVRYRIDPGAPYPTVEAEVLPLPTQWNQGDGIV